MKRHRKGELNARQKDGVINHLQSPSCVVRGTTLPFGGGKACASVERASGGRRNLLTDLPILSPRSRSNLRLRHHSSASADHDSKLLALFPRLIEVTGRSFAANFVQIRPIDDDRNDPNRSGVLPRNCRAIPSIAPELSHLSGWKLFE
jgi:hypothetical protein